MDRQLSPPRVALVSGFWGQNMGNAFFNIGGKWLLEQVFSPGTVSFIQDQPGLRTFHDQSKGNPRHSFDVVANADIDLVVMQGPLLTETAAALWAPTLRALSRRGARWLYLGAAADRRVLGDELGGRTVVRLEHRTNPFVGWTAFRRPNSVASDDPWTYASLYASASLVLADRVHAGVAGLAYGRPAMVFSPSPRTSLFDHLGIGDPGARPVELGSDRRRSELDGIVRFLQHHAT